MAVTPSCGVERKMDALAGVANRVPRLCDAETAFEADATAIVNSMRTDAGTMERATAPGGTLIVAAILVVSASRTDGV